MIDSIESFYAESMKLLNPSVWKKLFIKSSTDLYKGKG